MNQKYFRVLAGDAAYEQVRATLDEAWGHPNASTKTVTCIDPAAIAPRDKEGQIVLAVRQEFTAWEPASTLMPQLLASGAVQEISADDYRAAVHRAP
jgi:hypothetical protein